MHPNKIYMELKSEILNEIQLRNLALPKNRRAEPSHFGYTYNKPHGAEFWIQPSAYFEIKRNIVYQLEDEDVIKVLDETSDDMGYDGNRFIVQVKTGFSAVFKRHDKGIKIVKKLETEGLWVQANFEGEEIHLFIGQKEDDEGKHVHVIIGKTGEARVDPNDQAPGDLVKKVASITLKDGNEVRATLEFKKPD